MELFKIVVVEDEPIARRRLLRLLGQDEQVEVLGQAANGLEAIQCITHSDCDLVFLDIQLPDADGFEVWQGIYRDPMPCVVFVTAYDQYAIRAFGVNAIQYLLKPYEDADFFRVLKQAKEVLMQRRMGVLTQKMFALLNQPPVFPAALPALAAAYQEKFMIRSANRLFFVEAEQIEWIEATGNYAGLHVGKQVHLLRATILELEKKLDPAVFIRIHRSYLVNWKYVVEVRKHPFGEYEFVLPGDRHLYSSRSYAAKLYEYFQRFT